MMSFPLIIALYAGFTHAFETDHLLAVSNIVSRRSSMKMSLKDGIAWGLGHTTTILIIGVLLLLLRLNINVIYFHYFEALVGLMLVSLGISRLFKLIREKYRKKRTHDPAASEKGASLYHYSGQGQQHYHAHKLAYGVGLVHGIAGSGALVLLVMAQIKEPVNGLFYLLIFGMGSVAGMLVAAGFCSMPFSRNILQKKILQSVLIVLSGMLCAGYGSLVFYQNIFLV